MLCGGIQQVPAVKRIHDLGYKVIVTDIDPDAPAGKEADLFLNIGARDIQTISSWILANKESLDISGIFTLTNNWPSVSLIADATGLKTIGTEKVLWCDNKVLMKKVFRRYLLPTPESYEVFSVQDAKLVYERLKPRNAFLKIPDGFSGRGVTRIISESQIEDAFNAITKHTTYPGVLMEEEVIGHFFDIQGFFYDDELHLIDTSDSKFTNASVANPIEDFNISPSQLKGNIIYDAFSLLRDASKAFGVTHGPFSADMVLTKDGLQFIEISPRLHGPNGTLQMFPESTGTRAFDAMMQYITCDPINPSFLRPRWQKTAICKVFTSPREIENLVDFHNPDCFHTIKDLQRPSYNPDSATKAGLASVYICKDTLAECMDVLEAVKGKTTYG